MKKFVTMTLAVMAFVFGMISCSSSDDDDQPAEALATQVVGIYTGNEIFVVNNEESSNETKVYQFTKANDVTVDLEIPEVGMGMMTIPSFPIKGISLSKEGNSIKGKLASYEGTVKGTDGSDKTYTITDLSVLFTDGYAVVTYTMKYGKMPFAFTGSFTGSKTVY